MATTYQQMYASLPPFQQIVMEVLIARWRLGEPEWPFRSDEQPLRAAILALEAKGLVTWKHGRVEHTIRVSLAQRVTDDLPPYSAPILAKVWREGWDAANGAPVNPYESR